MTRWTTINKNLKLTSLANYIESGTKSKKTPCPINYYNMKSPIKNKHSTQKCT
jgi:hypothetical protein